MLKTTNSKDLYMRAIQEMYPGIKTGWLSSGLTFYDNQAQVGASAALKAFTYVKKMITDNMIVYDNWTSLFDDVSSEGSSDGSPVGCVKKDPKNEYG